MKLFFIFFVLIVLTVSVIVSACTTSKVALDPSLSNKEITIFKSQSCGCCSLYASYIKDLGLKLTTLDSDPVPIKQKYAIPGNMQSCHTSIIENYFVEGHVPIEAINKLLTEKPDIAGIALPDMPSGSPGMPGSKLEPFIIYAINKDSSITEFMRI